MLRRHRLLVAVLAVALLSGAAPAPAAPSEPPSGQPRGPYVNPVSRDIADTWADPAIIKAKDGWWYAYATSDPLREGDTEILPLHVARSQDLVEWDYLGPVFSEANRPTWADPETFYWAPDIRYVDGRYVLYTTVTNTTVSDSPSDGAIGVATAPTPAGPWTDSGEPVVAPRPGCCDDWLWTFDPALLTDLDGRRYLYYGSYYGGVFVTELSRDGLRAIGEPTQVAIDNRYEGTYVVRHGRHYYLFASAANCCAGPVTGYSVFVGRARSPLGPFVDRDGVSLLTSRVGGTPVISPNGNVWVGPGHNAVLTDLAGQDWFAYHAIDRRDPYLNGTDGINERPMLFDRLDWIDGWPTVRAGRWASTGRQPAPVTSGPVDDGFDRRGRFRRDWRAVSGDWRVASDGDESFARSRRRGLLLARASVPANARVEADLRLGGGADAAGVVARYRSQRRHVAAWLDRDRRALVTDVVAGGRQSRRRERLPAGFAYDQWHNVALELDGRELRVEVTDARLGDPVAVSERRLPRGLSRGRVGVATRGGGADADNISAARLHRPVRRPAPPPRVGGLARGFSDEFDDATLDPAWTWVRQDPDAVLGGGVLTWPTQAADLVGDANEAGVLLRDPPRGDYVVETKLAIDLGVDTVRNFQQAGLIAYAGDDDFARLSHVAIFNTRQVEFGREMPYAGRLAFGGMVVGPPATTTWLRLAHRVADNGEHRFRAASSRDGRRWTWGGTWTFPAGAAPRIGLVAHGGDTPQATARFDYVRIYR